MSNIRIQKIDSIDKHINYSIGLMAIWLLYSLVHYSSHNLCLVNKELEPWSDVGIKLIDANSLFESRTNNVFP